MSDAEFYTISADQIEYILNENYSSWDEAEVSGDRIEIDDVGTLTVEVEREDKDELAWERDYYIVFRLTSSDGDIRYFRIDGYYSSYTGEVSYNSGLYEVKCEVRPVKYWVATNRHDW